MCSSGGDSGTAADTVAGIDAALDTLAGMVPESGTAALGVLRELERLQRRITGLGYGLVRVVAEAPGDEFGGQRTRHVLADALRISPPDASARLFEAADLTPSLTMTGQPVEPVLPETAGRLEAGVIGRDHVRVIRKFFRGLPGGIDHPTRVEAEKQLAAAAATVRPDQLAKLATHMDAVINPDGALSDDRDRARKRGIRLGGQERDGMSRITGHISPELRAYLETILAKYAAPGMCNPDDDVPTIDSDSAGDVPDEQARRDQRTPTQRNHDALLAVLRAMIASGELGRHRGLPVTVIVTTTLQDLETAAGTTAGAGGEPGCPAPGRSPGSNGGKATTAGGTLVPYRDLIRMATHAWHYLAVFDSHTEQPLYLGRSKRLASPDQRIVATAQYGGCSFPACDRPALDCEHHHTTAWTAGGGTDITNLAPACGHHHQLADHGWTVHRDEYGRIEWRPPAWLDPDRTPRTNSYHYPANWYRHPNQRPNNTSRTATGPPPAA